MKPDLTTVDRWGLRAEWSRFLTEHTERRLARLAANPPTPKSERRISRSDAPSPQPQVPAKGLAPSAAE